MVGPDDPLNVAIVAAKIVVANKLVVKLVVTADKLLVAAVFAAKLVAVKGGTAGRVLCPGGYSVLEGTRCWRGLGPGGDSVRGLKK